MTWNDRRPVMPALLLAATLGGCGETSAGDPDPFVVRDSAGVSIVENQRPAWTAAPGWTLGNDPFLQVGGDDDGLPLFNVVLAATTTDGRVVIVNAGSRSIDWLDAAGAHLGSSGGSGEGPGEFRGIGWADLTPSDSLYVWDGQARRMSVFAEGEFVRAFGLEVPEPWGPVFVGGLLADGSVVAMATPLPGGDGREGVTRATVPAWIFSPDGEVTSELGMFRSSPVDLRMGATPGTVIRRVIPFGPGTLIGAAGNRIAVGDSERSEVAIHDAQGGLERIVRLPHAAEPVTADDLEAELERRLASAPPIEELRDGIRATFESTPAPEFKPHFDKLLVDPRGHLWVRRYPATGPEEGVPWDVIGTNGEWLGTLRAPAGLEVTQVNLESVIGVLKDEQGVESVRAFPLDRPHPLAEPGA